jgi:F0F1-type ATP synthase assembly protein I
MSLATLIWLAVWMAEGSIAFRVGSAAIAMPATVVVVVAALALGLELLDGLLLLPQAASSATAAITNRVAIVHRARRRGDFRGAR